MLLVLILGMLVTPISVTDTPDSGKKGNMVGAYSSAEGKTAFSKEADAEYAQYVTENGVTAYNEEIVLELLENASFASGSELEAINEELERYGMYLYSEETNTPTPASDSSDVRLSAPSIYYSTTGQCWYVTFSGYWLTDEWLNESSGNGNVGSQDAYGVYFSNTSGTFNSAIEDCYFRISNVGGANLRYTENLSSVNVDDEDGFFFKLQDKIINGTYQGEEWYGWCIYDSSFGSYSGYAYAFYIHTYSSCVINSITLGATPDGHIYEVEFTNAAYSFEVRSTSTKFNQ